MPVSIYFPIGRPRIGEMHWRLAREEKTLAAKLAETAGSVSCACRLRLGAGL
jgi:hypothetical protein